MIWVIKDKEKQIKTCYALFPKRIGDYRLQLHKYYKTWDFVGNNIYSSYVPHWFVDKQAAEEYVYAKKTREVL